MLRPRMPVFLMLHKGAFYKSQGFKNYTYIGDPVNTVRIFNDYRADELIIVDVDATSRGISPDFDLVTNLVSMSSMPICFGGGVGTLEHAGRLIDCGVEKVLISSAAFEEPSIVQRVAKKFGSQSISVCIDFHQSILKASTKISIKNDQLMLDVDLFSAVDEFISLGAGEIILNDVERDGMKCGFNLDLISKMVAYSSVPVTALGGASCLSDFRSLYKTCKHQNNMGIAAGSIWVYRGMKQAVLPYYPTPKEIKALFS